MTHEREAEHISRLLPQPLLRLFHRLNRVAESLEFRCANLQPLLDEEGR